MGRIKLVWYDGVFFENRAVFYKNDALIVQNGRNENRGSIGL